MIMGGRLSKIGEWELLAREADFRPAKMAALCCISTRQLERFFSLQFSDSPGQWLRKLQCLLAKELISQGYSNKAAAAELKFASESHFCREFKKQFGAPPQTFAPRWNVGFRQECRN
jgi:AraC-like DNA-binding protein